MEKTVTLEEALKRIEELEKENAELREELEKDFHEKRKLYRSMGILGGIFVVVLFL